MPQNTLMPIKSPYINNVISSIISDIYNPLTMPPKLLKAHEALDKAVDKLYRKEGFKSDTERVAHLFELNRGLTSLVGEDEKKAKRVKKLQYVIFIVVFDVLDRIKKKFRNIR
ncbi:MAG: hypothetical protein Q8R58_07655 [Sulfuricurvum sp.]|nr:hypothetical protein [Sulfuricurvum sp.]